jgi:hypothetical protein
MLFSFVIKNCTNSRSVKMPYKSRADMEKNRLFIYLEGFMSDEELKSAADLVISEAKKLKPGFSTINDISNFKPATPKGAEEISRAQVFLKENGVGHVIRIVGEKVLASIQFKRTQNDAGYIADHVTTMDDALIILDKEESRTESA